MAGFSAPFKPTIGYKSDITVALLADGIRTKPTAGTLAMTAAASKGATSLTITAVAGLSGELLSGQWLAFVDSNDLIYPVQLTADYAGSTSLNVAALDEAIPDASEAVFPTPLYLRQSASTDRSVNVTEFSTFDHDGVADATPGTVSSTGQFDGAYSFADTGGNTLNYALKNGVECYVEITYPVPSSAYSAGAKIGGAFLCESTSNPVPLEGEIGRNFSGRFTSYTETDPTPTA